MSNSLLSVDVFASLKSVEFCSKMAVDELKMLPNEKLGVAVLLEKYIILLIGSIKISLAQIEYLPYGFPLLASISSSDSTVSFISLFPSLITTSWLENCNTHW